MAESEDNFVVDGRMGFYFIPQSINILLKANEKVRAERLIGRGNPEEDPQNVREALKLVKQRVASDVVRYKKLYNINPYDEKHYDFVLDTTSNTTEESADEVYSFVKDRLK